MICENDTRRKKPKRGIKIPEWLEWTAFCIVLALGMIASITIVPVLFGILTLSPMLLMYPMTIDGSMFCLLWFIGSIELFFLCIFIIGGGFEGEYGRRY